MANFVIENTYFLYDCLAVTDSDAPQDGCQSCIFQPISVQVNFPNSFLLTL